MKVKASYLGVLLILALLHTGCRTQQRVTQSWVSEDLKEGAHYQKVFISVMSENEVARRAVEDGLTRQLEAWQVESVAGSEVLPVMFDRETKPERSKVLAVVRKRNCDAIFTVTVLHVNTEERYVPPTYDPYNAGYGFYGSFYGYYGYRYPVVYEPGYYRQDKTYLLESNLYDAASGKLVWTVQSTAFNPSSLQSWLKQYLRLMVAQMEKDDLISASK